MFTSGDTTSLSGMPLPQGEAHLPRADIKAPGAGVSAELFPSTCDVPGGVSICSLFLRLREVY